MRAGARQRRASGLLEPFEIEAGERQTAARKGGGAFAIPTPAVEAEDGAAVRDGEVGVHARAGLDAFADGPGLGFIAAEFDADILAGAALAGLGFAFGDVEIVRVGEEDQTLAIVVVAHDAAHADGFEQGVVKLRRAPLGGPIGTDGDEASMRFRFTADVEHDAAIVEFNGDGFVGIDPFVGARNGDVARVPGLALVIAVDGGGDTGAMRIAAGASGKPHGDHETPRLELDAVVRPGGQHFPVVVFFESIKRSGDFDGCAEGEAIIVAALIEDALVFEAEEHVNGAVFVSDEDGVVVGHVVGIDVLHLQREGVFRLRSFHIRDVLRGAPCFPIIGAAAEQDANVIPITDASGTLASFTPSQHSAFGRHDDTGDVVETVGGIVAHDKEVLFLDKWLGGMEEATEGDDEGGDVFHGYHSPWR